jgi:nicotinamidase-related amidase/mono/diheme cytochrome c family protein
MGRFYRWHGILGLAIAVLITFVILEDIGAPMAAVAMQAATPPASGSGPTIPAPVAVQVDPKTTALLVLDVTSTICQPRPSCVATLSADAALLKKARDAGALVVYSDTPGASTILSQVAQQPNEPKVTGRADKFFGTNLDETLKGKGIKTVVIVGYVANGAVLYTAFGATVRGYTAVVAVDGTGAEDPFAVTLTQYQLLNQPGLNNPQNQPLAEGRVTLSKSDLITFVPGAPGPKPLATAQPAGTPPATTSAATVAPTAAATAAATSAATAAPTAGASSSGEAKTLADLFPPGPGKELVLENCGTCHSPACPVFGQRSQDHWKSVKTNHQSRVSGMSDDDYNALFDYLAQNFNDTKPEPKTSAELRANASCSAGF